MKVYLLALLLSFFIPDFQEYHLGEQVDINELGEIEFRQIGDFNADNLIYLADTKAKKVFVFDKKGSLIKENGRQGRGPGEYVHGPRLIAPTKEEVYVIGMMPYFVTYDKHLSYKENKKIEINPINTTSLKYIDGKLYLIANQYFKEDVFIFDPNNKSIEEIDLDLKIEPGLLSKRTLYQIGDYWLFAWHFQNKFKVLDNNFKEVNDFKVPGIQDEAEGEIVKSDLIPDEATAYRAEVYKAGAFYPDGTFFDSFVVLDEDHFMVQLGTLTGGSNKAIILDLKGNIKQTVTLPENNSRILAYANETLFMTSRGGGTVSAYQFYN